MSDWSDDAIRKLKERGDRRTAAQKEDEIRKTQGEFLWKQIRQQIREECEELNKGLGDVALTVGMSQSQTVLDVRFAYGNEDIRELHAEFNLALGPGSLNWNAAGAGGNLKHSGSYSLVVAGGIASFQDQLQAASPKQIAEKMLSALVPK